METSPKVMLPFHIAVAMNKYPLESLSAPAADSIREKWEKGFRPVCGGGFLRKARVFAQRTLDTIRIRARDTLFEHCNFFSTATKLSSTLTLND